MKVNPDGSGYVRVRGIMVGGKFHTCNVHWRAAETKDGTDFLRSEAVRQAHEIVEALNLYKSNVGAGSVIHCSYDDPVVEE